MRENGGRSMSRSSLAAHLAAFEVPAPDPAETAALASRVRALALGRPGAFRERVEVVRRRTTPFPAAGRAGWLMLLRYVALPGGTGPAPVALLSMTLIAVAAAYAAADGTSSLIVFSFVTPVLSALGVAYAFRSAGTGAWEMEMSCPVTPVELTLARLVTAAGYSAAAGLVLSLAIWWGRPPALVVQLIVTWLAPLVLCSGLALYVSLRWGAPAAAGLTVAVWGAQVAARAYGLSLTMLRLPGDAGWGLAQFMSLALGGALVAAALRLSGRCRDLCGGLAP